MKKNILIFCAVLITLSLMAFGIINSNDSKANQLESTVSKEVALKAPVMEKVEKEIFADFIYDVGPRFNPIKKTELDNITSFNDIIGYEHAQRVVEYKSMSVIIIKEDKQSIKRKTGESGDLTIAQLNYLKSLDYSTNFMISAEILEKNKVTGKLEDTHWTPYHTIIPENQAVYVKGKDALIYFLKEKGKEAIVKANVEAEKLQPAKLYFTVTKNGAVENVKLDRSSNYPEIDKLMIKLIQNTPDTWIPAENTKGEKVSQELVVSFGLMGC